jgi:hypothetical protein
MRLLPLLIKRNKIYLDAISAAECVMLMRSEETPGLCKYDCLGRRCKFNLFAPAHWSREKIIYLSAFVMQFEYQSSHSSRTLAY